MANNKTTDLKSLLTQQNRLRWLDIGCGGNFEPGFFYLDFYSTAEISPELSERYFNIDILSLTGANCRQIGTFDLVRMQHTFEHFAPEEGKIVLSNCARLLNPGGYLLITVPDLAKFINYYRKNSFHKLYSFYHWALNRIEKDAPPSFFFSIFTHSLLHEQHKWCYDYQGLKYIIEKSGLYTNIKQLKLFDKLSIQPFTHNRTAEDVCVIANLK